MIYLLSFAISILVATLFLKGSLRNIFTFINTIKKPWLAVLGCTFQLIPTIFTSNRNSFFLGKESIFLGMSFVIYALFWIYNKKYLGCILIGIGLIFNAFAIMFNGGRMPVDITTYQDLGYKHTVITSNTKLLFLCDIIHPPKILKLGMEVISLGDIVIALGVFFIILSLLTLKTYTKFK